MGDDDAQPDKATRIHAILDDCLRRRLAGEVLPDNVILAAHPDLLAELAEELRNLALIQQAARWAHGRASDTNNTPLGDTVCVNRAPGSTVQRDDLTLPRQLGPVRLIREIGRGGMGVVWLGRDELLGRDVAVKVLLDAVSGPDDPGFSRFLEGARAAAGIRHLGLTTLHHADLVDGVPYLVMDYVDGPTLAEVVRSTGPLSPGITIQVLRSVCDALGELHDLDLVHRDIKPANILVNGDGQVFVTDFGLACPRTVSTAGDGRRAIAGTPPYMAPELFEGVFSIRSDVYALGVMAFELLTGQRPFHGDLESLIAQHRSAELPTVFVGNARLDAALNDVLRRATHKEAVYRYKSARLFFRAIEEATGAYASRSSIYDLARLVDRCRTEGKRSAADSLTPRTPSSYFDRIAELALQRQSHRDSRREAPTEESAGVTSDERPTARPHADDRRADSLFPQIGTDTAGVTLAVDIPCVGCNYNLRGLWPDGRCPECGRAVADSLKSDRLMFSDPRWLAWVARGLFLCRIGLWTLVAVPVVLLLSLIWTEGLSLLLDTHPSLTKILMALVSFGPLLAGLVLATKREPSEQAPDPRARRTSRVLILAAGLSFVLGYYIVCFALLGLGSASVALHLRILAFRIPDSRMASRTLIAALSAATFPVLLSANKVVLHIQGGSIRAVGDVYTWVIVFWVLGILVAFGSAVYASRAALLKTMGICVSRNLIPFGVESAGKPAHAGPVSAPARTVQENLLDVYLRGMPEMQLFESDLHRRLVLTDLPRTLKTLRASARQPLSRLIRTRRFWLQVGVVGAGTLIITAVVKYMNFVLKSLEIPAPLEALLSFVMFMVIFGFFLLHNIRRQFQQPLRLKLLEQGVPVCLGCGYPLLGLPLESARCPECGRAFDERVRELLSQASAGLPGAGSPPLMTGLRETRVITRRKQVRLVMLITGIAMILAAGAAFSIATVYPPMQRWYWEALILGIGLLGFIIGLFGQRRYRIPRQEET